MKNKALLNAGGICFAFYCVAVAASFLIVRVRTHTYTYTVKTPVWETTNAIEVIPNHEPSCTLIRYVQDGRTNEFHAWLVPVVVITNR